MVIFRMSFRKENIYCESHFDLNTVGLIKQISLRFEKKCWKCRDVCMSAFQNPVCQDKLVCLVRSVFISNLSLKSDLKCFPLL